VETEQQAQIVLGRLLEQASAGRRPDSGVTVAELLARYSETLSRLRQRCTDVTTHPAGSTVLLEASIAPAIPPAPLTVRAAIRTARGG
jgi:hypothetical protein